MFLGNLYILPIVFLNEIVQIINQSVEHEASCFIGPFIIILVILIDENGFFAKFKIFLIAIIHCFNISILRSKE